MGNSRLVDLINDFVQTLHLEYGVKNIKIGLPRELNLQYEKEIMDKYDWIKSDCYLEDMVTNKINIQLQTSKLTLENYE